jgi:hypothetical protein
MVLRNDYSLDSSGLSGVQQLSNPILAYLRLDIAEALDVPNTINDLKQSVHITVEIDHAIRCIALNRVLLGRDYGTLTNKKLSNHYDQFHGEAGLHIRW